MSENKVQQILLQAYGEIDSNKQELLKPLVAILEKECASNDNLELEIKKYQTIFDSIPFGIAITSPTGKVLQVNKALASVGGYTPNDLIGKRIPMLKLFPPDSLREVLGSIAAILRNKKPISLRTNINHADGSIRTVIFDSVLFDYNGSVQAIISYVKDITQEQQVREQLSVEKDKSRIYLESSDALVLVTDSAYKIIYSNPMADKILANGKKLFGNDWLDVIAPVDQREYYASEYEKLLSDSKSVLSQKSDIIAISPSNIRQISWRRTVITETGNKKSVFHFGIDTTYVYQSQQELKVRSSLQMLISDISSSLIYIPKDEFQIRIVNIMERIGKFIGVDRLYIFFYSDDQSQMSIGYDWAIAQEKKIPDKYRVWVPITTLPNMHRTLLSGKVFKFENINELPQDAVLERDEFLNLGIKSMLVVPIITKNIVKGFIGMTQLTKTRRWLEDMTNIMRIVGQNIMFAIERNESEEKLEKRNAELEKVNRLMVGREIRVKELKQQLARYQDEN